jgi:hypothetical protein
MWLKKKTTNLRKQFRAEFIKPSFPITDISNSEYFELMLLYLGNGSLYFNNKMEFVSWVNVMVSLVDGRKIGSCFYFYCVQF